MRFTSRSCLLLLALGLCGGASAANVYTWKDANGVTHSSDQPPPGRAYETRRIDGSGPEVDTVPQAEEAPSPQCVSARRNLAILGSAGAVQQDSDGDGKPDRTLGDDERAAQKELAEAAVKAYCKQA
ncbi:DUF4124 domain-containing protein [Pseudoxanthomonas sp. J35]|uniref:DUF4124 domain-containing protein n=1 Tax=Pseudoxanthomonas sp. J35 TaxID=935852 RepID=UPI00048DDE18|nr:DUF4124 domain-containing protein [Pseudoxanthomonas sp. J35]